MWQGSGTREGTLHRERAAGGELCPRIAQAWESAGREAAGQTIPHSAAAVKQSSRKHNATSGGEL